jgi:hypothetical protein
VTFTHSSFLSRIFYSTFSDYFFIHDPFLSRTTELIEGGITSASSTGLIIGLVVGIVVLLLLGFLIIIVVRRRSANEPANEHEMNYETVRHVEIEPDEDDLNESQFGPEWVSDDWEKGGFIPNLGSDIEFNPLE